MTQPDPVQLESIAQAIADGSLRSTIPEVLGLAEPSAAVETNRIGHASGKIVVDFKQLRFEEAELLTVLEFPFRARTTYMPLMVGRHRFVEMTLHATKAEDEKMG